MYTLFLAWIKGRPSRVPGGCRRGRLFCRYSIGVARARAFRGAGAAWVGGAREEFGGGRARAASCGSAGPLTLSRDRSTHLQLLPPLERRGACRVAVPAGDRLLVADV